jgi:GDSL-like Lipase/Acylhydrolase family
MSRQLGTSLLHNILGRRGLLALGAAITGALLSRGRSRAENGMKHVVLLGDSIFDNAAYVGTDPDVVRQVRQLLPEGWRATLNARDGSVIADIPAQLRVLPPDATHLVISIGGNDALLQSGVLQESVASVADALEQLAAVRESFQGGYAAMLEQALSRGLPTAVCTIYEPRYPEPRLRRVAATALTLLNDAITREAFARGATLIDLRLVCDQDEDFANPIEPSARGGAKIARAIAGFVRETKASSAVIAK